MTTRTRAAFLTLIFNIWILCLVERIGTHWLLWDSNTFSALLNDCVANSEVWDCTETVVHIVWWYHELWVEPNAFSPSLDLDEMWRESKCHKRNWEISREKGIKSLMYHCTWGQRIRIIATSVYTSQKTRVHVESRKTGRKGYENEIVLVGNPIIDSRYYVSRN